MGLVLLASCDLKEITSDAGPQLVEQYSITVDSSLVQGITSKHSSATNAYGEALHCGHYKGVSNQVLLQFSYLYDLDYYPDSVSYRIDKADLVLTNYKRWPADGVQPTVTVSLLGEDSLSIWSSSSDIDSLWTDITSGAVPLSSTCEETGTETIFHLGTDMVAAIESWHDGGVNTGLLLSPLDGENGMQAWYSRDYSTADYSVKLKLFCTLLDTADGTTPVYYDTLSIATTADVTYSTTDRPLPVNTLAAEAGTIIESSFAVDSLKSLLPGDAVISSAEMTIPVTSMDIEPNDTVMVYLQLSKDDGSGTYTAVSGMLASDTLTADVTSLRFSLAVPLQYLIGGGRGSHERLFLRFADEYNTYSRLQLNRSGFSLDLFYTELGL